MSRALGRVGLVSSSSTGIRLPDVTAASSWILKDLADFKAANDGNVLLPLAAFHLWRFRLKNS
jgi:hypothetical protein